MSTSYFKMSTEYHLTKALQSEKLDDTDSEIQEADHLLEGEEAGFIRGSHRRALCEHVHMLILYIAVVLLSSALVFLVYQHSHCIDPSQQVWCKYHNIMNAKLDN